MISVTTLPAGAAPAARSAGTVSPGADTQPGITGFAGVAERVRTAFDAPATAEQPTGLADGEPLTGEGLLAEDAGQAGEAQANGQDEPAMTDESLPDLLAGDESPASHEDAPSDEELAVEGEQAAPSANPDSDVPDPLLFEATLQVAETPGESAPVQLWRLREQARGSVEGVAQHSPAMPAGGAVSSRPHGSLPESNSLLLQRLGGAELARPEPPAGTSPITPSSEPAPAFAAGLTARPSSAQMHEWAPLQLQPGNKAGLGEQLLQALRDKVDLQLNQQVQQARIRLDPPEMGRMELTVRMEGDRLHVQINASHAGLRDAITAQADRLRHDLQLHHGGGVEVNVGQGDRQDTPASFNEDIQIGAALNDGPEQESRPQSGLGWINALA